MATKCQYEMSKTYQYRKVMKPLLERRRRARINKCLDDLKDLLGDYMRQNGEPNVKLEKADILEVTVEHFRKLKLQKQHRGQMRQDEQFSRESFRNGYIQAADEVSRCLASLPRVDIAFGTKLMTHLGLRLNQLESTQSSPISIHTPLSINCSTTATTTAATSVASQSTAYSPGSSGYSSDNSDYVAQSSPNISTSQGLLQISNTLWRPW